MRHIRLIAAGLLLVLSNAVALAEKRVALVVGNSTYQATARLANPAREQFMEGFLDAHSKYGEGFAGKVGLCKSQNAAKIDAPMWAVLGAVNKLRNKIAHTFDQAQIKSRMGDLRTAYLAAISPTQAKDSEKLPDTSIVVAACGLCAAYLVVATDAAQTPKKT